MCDTKSRLDGKVAVITGGSSGVGLEAAKKFANLGAKVIIASRNENKLKTARDEIERVTGNPNVAYKVFDLASLKSVRSFANDVNMENRVDILVNNVGILGLPDKLTEDGLNLTMQVNYFSSFLLTYLLLPLMMKSAPSRIVNVSAVSIYIGEIDFDHWNDIGRYSTLSSAGNSKLALALFTAELSRKFKSKDVAANSLDPLVVKDTDAFKNLTGVLKELSRFFVTTIGQEKEDVGKQVVYLAASPNLKGVSGEYYQFCKPWVRHWLAHDTVLTKKLWNASKKVVNITEAEDWEMNMKL